MTGPPSSRATSGAGEAGVVRVVVVVGRRIGLGPTDGTAGRVGRLI